MNKKLVLAIGLFLLGGLSLSLGDGFIVVERPIYVPPTHFPFAPLEVTSHHVNVVIDGQVAITSIDQEFYNPNDQRLEGFYMFPVRKGRTSTSSAWKSAARASMRSCFRLTRLVAFMRTLCEKC